MASLKTNLPTRAYMLGALTQHFTELGGVQIADSIMFYYRLPYTPLIMIQLLFLAHFGYSKKFDRFFALPKNKIVIHEAFSCIAYPETEKIIFPQDRDLPDTTHDLSSNPKT